MPAETIATQRPAAADSGAVKLKIAPLVDHLLSLRTGRLRSTTLFAQYCQYLRQLGIALERATLHVPQLHPQISARAFLWLAETGGAMETGRRHGMQKSAFYLESPVRRIYEGAGQIRRRLSASDAPLDFPILEELKAEGFSDYYMTSLAFSTGARPNAVSFAAKSDSGFSEADIALIEASLPALGAVLEVRHQRQTARQLLTTYIGPNAGERVLNGDILRGRGEVIHATLWYCDLRGFTELSEQLPSDEMIQLLNDYFEVMAQPVKGRGGEILKFIGDAMLAIFPIEGGPEGMPCEACCKAILAAQEGLDGIAAFNEMRQAEAKPPIRAGVALSRGDVVYGNIGDAERLDFTAIGPAVNLATRLEGLTRDLDPPIVFTRDVAEASGRPFRHLGAFDLKGIALPQDAFTLA